MSWKTKLNRETVLCTYLESILWEIYILNVLVQTQIAYLWCKDKEKTPRESLACVTKSFLKKLVLQGPQCKKKPKIQILFQAEDEERTEEG